MKLVTKSIFITLTLLFTTSSFAYNNEMHLKGGLNTVVTKARAFNNTNSYFSAIGLNSHFGYRRDKWEYNITSYAYYGKVKDLDFHINDNIIKASDSSVRSISISPTLKYITDYSTDNNWHLFFSIAPCWALQTIKPKDYELQNSPYSPEHKIIFHSKGAQSGS